MPTVPKECLTAKEDCLGPQNNNAYKFILYYRKRIQYNYSVEIKVQITAKDYLIARGLGRLGTSFYLL